MSSAPAIPARIAWAVAQLPLAPDDKVLEIGPGSGAAAELICSRLPDGHYLGVDRSARAVRASAERNAEHLARGRAKFRQVALADLQPEALPGFDHVLAINVNLFWTGPARQELDLIRRLLSDRGRLHLSFDSPRPDGVDRLSRALAEHLSAADYRFTTSTATFGTSRLLWLSARPV